MAPRKQSQRKGRNNNKNNNNNKKKSSNKESEKKKQVKQVKKTVKNVFVEANKKKRETNQLQERLDILDDDKIVKTSDAVGGDEGLQAQAAVAQVLVVSSTAASLQQSIKGEKVEVAEKSTACSLGGGVKRKCSMKSEDPGAAASEGGVKQRRSGGSIKREKMVDFDENHSKWKLLSERKGQLASCDYVKNSLTSCLEIIKLVVWNLPADCTCQADLARLFGHYRSLQCTYMLLAGDHSAAAADAPSAAVLIFNDEAQAMQLINDYNGLLLDGSDVALKVELISSMRRYEYGSPLNLIHYQVVNSPSLFRQAFKSNNPTIKSDIESDQYPSQFQQNSICSEE